MSAVDGRVIVLRAVLIGHCILMTLAFVLVFLSWAGGNRDWIHGLFAPYAVGILSIVSALAVLLVGGLARRKSEGP